MSRKISGWLSPLLGGVICLALGVTALWVVLSGKKLTGGILFLPEAIDSVIGAVLIGIGGLLCLLLSYMAFNELYQSIKKKE